MVNLSEMWWKIRALHIQLLSPLIRICCVQNVAQVRKQRLILSRSVIERVIDGGCGWGININNGKSVQV